MAILRRISVPAASVLVVLLAAVLGCSSSSPSDDERPRLVVSVVVDQLPRYLMERYDTLFTGGLRRLLDEGHDFPDAVHAHATTETAVGHASLATGALPARHGIVANDFFRRERDGWVPEYAVEDPGSPLLGEPDAEGRSPENLLASGLADWMLLADSASKRVSISKKDRSAIAHGGASPGHVYWLSPTRLRMVTSAYYMDAPPSWLDDFNRTRMAALRADTVWESVVPPEWTGLTRPDTSTSERLEVRASAFPHRYWASESAGGEAALYDWVIRTPFVDAALLDLARRSIDELSLGDDDAPDFLAIGLSQTDYVGHRYGPLSREQLDNLIRLDRELGRFMDDLDRRVGEGRWVLGFSADHGVLPMPEHYAETQGWGHRGTPEDERRIRQAVSRGLERGGGAEERQERIATALEEVPIVADAITEAELLARGEPADTFIRLYRNQYREDRRPGEISTHGVWLRFREGVLSPGWETGTSHGSPYLYDRRVPLIFLGSTVPPGVTEGRGRTVDYAPTLARLVGIPHPEEVDGTALLDNSASHD